MIPPHVHLMRVQLERVSVKEASVLQWDLDLSRNFTIEFVRVGAVPNMKDRCETLSGPGSCFRHHELLLALLCDVFQFRSSLSVQSCLDLASTHMSFPQLFEGVAFQIRVYCISAVVPNLMHYLRVFYNHRSSIESIDMNCPGAVQAFRRGLFRLCRFLNLPCSSLGRIRLFDELLFRGLEH